MLTYGTLLQQRYRILRLVGQGGMGAVYQAQDLRLSRIVALKENVGGAPRRFQQEAVLLANLSHPNLPEVYYHFVEPNGAQYLVMKFVEGQDLQSRLDGAGALPEPQALAWFDQILDAVAYLHSRGVIHRDVKPANIKLTPEGKAVLVDFGIAKVCRPGQMTLSGARAATPGYATPEQYGGGTDQRSDIYSLGATLYALLVGHAPPDALALASGVASLTPPRRLNPALTPRVEQAISRALVEQPAQRWQTVGDFRSALTSPLRPSPSREGVTQPTAPVRLSLVRGASVPERSEGRVGASLPPWARAVGGAGAMFVVVLMMLGVAGLFGGGRPVTPTPASTQIEPPPTFTALPPMVFGPAGDFTMGSSNSDTLALDSEKP